MQSVLTHIDERARRLGEHTFFATLRSPEPHLRRAMAFAPFAGFWVLAFQDMIRLNARLAVDPAFRRLLENHVQEDSGHDVWFFEDLEQIFGTTYREVSWLFSAENLPSREVSYALLSEVYRVDDDHLRFLLVEALEAGAKTYFDRLSQLVIELGHGGRLKYFAGIHLQEEEAHELHTEEAVSAIRDLVLPDDTRSAAVAMVDRVFDAFERFGDFLLDKSQATSRYAAPTAVSRTP